MDGEDEPDDAHLVQKNYAPEIHPSPNGLSVIAGLRLAGLFFPPGRRAVTVATLPSRIGDTALRRAVDTSVTLFPGGGSHAALFPDGGADTTLFPDGILHGTL